MQRRLQACIKYRAHLRADFKFKDLTKDGRITEEDRQYIGNPWPKLIYGLNLSLSWRWHFDLDNGVDRTAMNRYI